jgi:FKBP-type peptidyl-prolyl cis-trans isomerase 2
VAEAQSGDKVKVHYTGKLADGTVFDTTEDATPFEFTIGADEVIAGFEEAVQGMEPGDAKTVTLPPEEAYGPRNDEWVLEVDRDELPDQLDVEVGQQLRIEQEGGESTIVRVSEVNPETVKLDANHPLAGEELTFEIELVEVE